MTTFTIDAAGLDLIRSFEGYVNGAYPDSRGFATCGVGHLLHESEPTAADHELYDGKGWAFFSSLLKADVKRVCLEAMEHYIHIDLTQNEVNPLLSIAFNCGGGVFAGGVGRAVNAKNWPAVYAAMMEWDKPAVLVGRRKQEVALLKKAVAAASKAHVQFPWLTVKERAWVLEYDHLLAQKSNLARRRVLRALMHTEAVNIAAAAHKTKNGWDIASRRQRYHSLTARSGS